MKVWLQPRHYERRFGRFLRKTVEELRIQLLKRLGDVVRLQTRTNANTAAESDLIDTAIAEVFEWWRNKREENRPTYGGYFGLVNLFNDNQFLAVVLSETGLRLPPNRYVSFKPGAMYSNTVDMTRILGDDADIYRQESYLETVRDNWVKTQDTYVDNIVNQAVKNTEIVTRNAIVSSVNSVALREAINKVLETAANRINRGGEEAVSKLNSVLTRERQKSIGANEYIWETQRDERVRGNPNGLYPKAKPSHFHRQGKIFSFDRPPEGGNPGEAEGCRCWARLKWPR